MKRESSPWGGVPIDHPRRAARDRGGPGVLNLVPLGPLAHQLAVAANGLGLLAGPSLGRLLVVPTHPHFAVEALALHLLLQRAQRLVDVVVANLNLDDGSHSRKGKKGTTRGRPLPETVRS